MSSDRVKAVIRPQFYGEDFGRIWPVTSYGQPLIQGSSSETSPMSGINRKILLCWNTELRATNGTFRPKARFSS
jgi:hypothetical protein